MRKIGLLALLGLVFAVGLGSEASAERGSVGVGSNVSQVTNAKVFEIRNKNGRATCVVYPDSRGDYTDIADIVFPGLEGSTDGFCGGCPKGQMCVCVNSKVEENGIIKCDWECKEPAITLPPKD